MGRDVAGAKARRWVSWGLWVYPQRRRKGRESVRPGVKGSSFGQDPAACSMWDKSGWIRGGQEEAGAGQPAGWGEGHHSAWSALVNMQGVFTRKILPPITAYLFWTVRAMGVSKAGSPPWNIPEMGSDISGCPVIGPRPAGQSHTTKVTFPTQFSNNLAIKQNLPEPIRIQALKKKKKKKHFHASPEPKRF